jgi:bifunctional non-homologous end joining protein LigD
MLWRSSSPARHPSGFIEPCLPTNGSAVPTGPRWAYEIKHDGYRFICRRDGDRVRVFSRRGHDYTDRAPAIAEAVMSLPVTTVTLNGEGVVCDGEGITDFARLRAAVARDGSRAAFLYAFDLLELDGTDMRREPWDVRRATLASLLRNVPRGIRFSEHINGADGETVFQHACHMGLEGSWRIGLSRCRLRTGPGPPMTLGNMRELGVHHLIAYLNDVCRHTALINESS